ncbi:MAG: hypothetical protein JJU29_09090 [Verrucomicrobia bacterium]|nr:hypothetical protein [Verrucomicrobiota bacterium]MCH8511807.1 hypothetical protein [Kiritimatiellia bacterium]
MIKPVEPDDEIPDIGELNLFLQNLADDLNHLPDPEIGGFSPEMLFRLMGTEWNSPDCPLKFGTDLPLSVMSAAPFFVTMRSLLLYPFESWGLLESKIPEGHADDSREKVQLRVTPFYDQWIRFNPLL